MTQQKRTYDYILEMCNQWLKDHLFEYEEVTFRQDAFSSSRASYILTYKSVRKNKSFTKELFFPMSVMMYITDVTMYHIMTDALQCCRDAEVKERGEPAS